MEKALECHIIGLVEVSHGEPKVETEEVVQPAPNGKDSYIQPANTSPSKASSASH